MPHRRTRRAAAADDLDVLPVVGQERELQRAGRGRLVMNDEALDAADEQIEALVAIDVHDGGDVLAIERDRQSVGIDERAARLESRGLLCAGISKEQDVAERLFSQQVQVAVRIQIDEAIPLADVEVLIAIGPLLVLRRRRLADVLEEPDLVPELLEKQIEIAVGIDVGELRPRNVEAAKEGDGEWPARLVRHGKWRDDAGERDRCLRESCGA
jgi:hypothetical protein